MDDAVSLPLMIESIFIVHARSLTSNAFLSNPSGIGIWLHGLSAVWDIAVTVVGAVVVAVGTAVASILYRKWRVSQQRVNRRVSAFNQSSYIIVACLKLSRY